MSGAAALHPEAARRRRFVRWLVAGGCAAAALGLAFGLREVFNPLLLGLLFAYILNPLAEWLERHRVPRALAVPVLFAVVLVGLVGSVSFASFKAAGRLVALRGRLVGEKVLDPDDPRHAAIIKAALDEGTLHGPPPPQLLAPPDPTERAPALRALPEPAAPVAERDGVYFIDRDGDGERKVGLVEQVTTYFVAEFRQLELGQDDLKKLARAFEDNASSLADYGVEASQGLRDSFGQAGTFLSYLLLVPLYTFFLLQSFPRLRDGVRDHLPGAYRDQVVRIAGRINLQVSAFFRGRLLLALIKGTVTWIGLWLAGVPFSFVIGMSAGLLSIVPLIGPLVGGSLAIVVSYGGGDGFLLQVLWIALALGAAELAEAIGQPLLLGREVGLHPLVLILAFFVFGRLFGMFGLLLAVPIACVVKTLFEELALPQIEALAAEPPDDEPAPAVLAPAQPAVPSFARLRPADA